MLLLFYFILDSFLHAMDANNIQQGRIISESYWLAHKEKEGQIEQ